MATLYLHVGTPKTGTSAIQDFCYVNRELLRRKGLAFPIFDPYQHVNNGRNGHFMAEYAHTGFRQGSAEEKTWLRRLDEVQKMFHDVPNVLLSDEAFWEWTRGERARLWDELKREADARGFDVKVIVYLRRQDEYIASRWAQHVKEVETDWSELSHLTCSQAIAFAKESGQYDYYSHLARINSALGGDWKNLIVRIYERKRFADGDVVADFMSVLGIEIDAGFARPKEESNPSISGNLLEIMRNINALPHGGAKKPPMMVSAAVDCARMDEERRRMSPLSEQERAELLALCEPSNRQIAREYFGTDAPLFSPPGAAAPEWRPESDEMIASVVRYFGEVILRQQEQIDALKERFYLRRKARHLLSVVRGRLHSRFARGPKE